MGSWFKEVWIVLQTQWELQIADRGKGFRELEVSLLFSVSIIQRLSSVAFLSLGRNLVSLTMVPLKHCLIALLIYAINSPGEDYYWNINVIWQRRKLRLRQVSSKWQMKTESSYWLPLAWKQLSILFLFNISFLLIISKFHIIFPDQPYFPFLPSLPPTLLASPHFFPSPYSCSLLTKCKLDL